MSSNDPNRGMSRRRFLQRIVGSAGVAITAQLLAACGGAPATDPPKIEPAGATNAPAANAPAAGGAATTLTIMMGEAEFSNDQIKAFTDAHPSIKIERVEDDD